jgi:hypothetical protein
MKNSNMIHIKTIAFILICCFAANGHTQVVTESWMRQAGISCGGGLSMEVQGEIDAMIISRLRVGKVQADGKFQMSEAQTLLKQFQQEEKQQIYVNYTNCLMALMNSATATSQLPPRDVVLNSSIAVASLETVKRGQRFVMTPGDTVAIKDHTLILTVNRVRTRGNLRFVDYTWSNSETGEGRSKFSTQSTIISLGKKCSLVPYQIDVDNEQVSLLSNC